MNSPANTYADQILLDAVSSGFPHIYQQGHSALGGLAGRLMMASMNGTFVAPQIPQSDVCAILHEDSSGWVLKSSHATLEGAKAVIFTNEVLYIPTATNKAAA